MSKRGKEKSAGKRKVKGKTSMPGTYRYPNIRQISAAFKTRNAVREFF
jgi:hypothetical protein